MGLYFRFAVPELTALRSKFTQQLNGVFDTRANRFGYEVNYKSILFGGFGAL